MRKRILLAALVLSAFLFGMTTVGGADSSETGQMLRFMNKQFDPLADQKARTKSIFEPDSVLESRTQQAGMAYYVVQFDGPVQLLWKEELTELGVTFFDYVPEYAFIIKADASNESAIRDSSHVRWLGPYAPELKISEHIYNVSPERLDAQEDAIKVRVIAFAGEDAQALQEQIEDMGGMVLSVAESDWDTTLVVSIPLQQVRALANISGVKWIERASENKISNNVGTDIIEARGIRDKTWPVSGAKLYGAGQIVAVCDTGLDTGVIATMHKDFSDSDDGSGASRVINNVVLAGATTQDTNGHGTHVAGTVVGNGVKSGAKPSTSTFPDSSYAGIAPKAQLYFQTVADADGNLNTPSNLNDLFQPAYDAGARVHTNSWGTDGVGSYSGESLNVDQFSWANKDILILFSAGNDGKDKDRDGVIDRYSLDSQGTAKNCLTVGASESYRKTGGFAQQKWGEDVRPVEYGAEPVYSDLTSDKPYGMAAFSSCGPTLDGRYKPEIVAPGTNILSTRSSVQTGDGWGAFNDFYYYSGGTSMATPMTAGAAVLMREYLIKEEAIASPSAALVKAALIHGSIDSTPGQYGSLATKELSPAPDYAQGWGRLNLEGALNVDSNYKTVFNDVTSSAPADTTYNKTFLFNVADKGEPFRATMSWTDYPGSVAANGGLVNDLDLRVQAPDGTWLYPDNARNLSALESVAYVSSNNGFWGDDKIALRVTPSSYPSQLESVNVFMSNNPEKVSKVAIVLYSWTGSAIGKELFRKEYAYLSEGENLVPIGYDLTSGSVVVAVEKSNSDLGVIVENGNPTGRSFDVTNGAWTAASYTPAIQALFRTTPASSQFDRVNNTVTVTVEKPAVGTYTAEVTAHNVPNGPQPYALIMSGLVTPIAVSGDNSIQLNPTQPNAPTVAAPTTDRDMMTTADIEQETGVRLNTVYSDVVEFSCTITGNYGEGLVSMRYGVNGLPAASADSLSLTKLLGGGNSLSFSYPELEKYEDGNWWLTDAGGSYISPNTILDPSTTYYVLSVVKDNGPYDANPALNIVNDPQVLGGSSSFSGGCTIGSQNDMTTTLLMLVVGVVMLCRSRRKHC